MGLFDFFKNKKSEAIPEKETDDIEQESKSVFKGDLARFDERFVAEKRYEDLIEEEHIDSHLDSSDSIVFMSFPVWEEKNWRCPECGTLNDMNMTGCVVCGFTK